MKQYEGKLSISTKVYSLSNHLIWSEITSKITTEELEINSSFIFVLDLVSFHKYAAARSCFSYCFTMHLLYSSYCIVIAFLTIIL